jgi:hypothetical protein
MSLLWLMAFVGFATALCMTPHRVLKVTLVMVLIVFAVVLTPLGFVGVAGLIWGGPATQWGLVTTWTVACLVLGPGSIWLLKRGLFG